MQTNVKWEQLKGAPVSRELLRYLSEFDTDLGLKDAYVFYRFPIYRSPDGDLIETNILLVSPSHGVVIFWANEHSIREGAGTLKEAEQSIDEIFSSIYSRLIRNKSLKKDRSTLVFRIHTAIYAPSFEADGQDEGVGSALLRSTAAILEFLSSIKDVPVPIEVFNELLSTLEGAKGLIKPKPRETSSLPPTSKGVLVERLEAEVALFDRRQQQGYAAVSDGVHRIRGIAGSGKTIVLAMKAALTHIRYPEATIVYTFHTKSLYQLVKRLITRFYRQFEDQDPAWDERIFVMHGWGGAGMPGIYSEACRVHGVPGLSYAEASLRTKTSPFDFACNDLLKNAGIKPMYDFMFVDEGQDFPLSFLKLCKALAVKERMVLAYDELQTIFQVKSPSAAEIFGIGKDGTPLGDFVEDIVLYKCYRNPREILVCAHAIGLGIYSNKIVQMLENKEHWEDIGYKVIAGSFKEGEETIINRPEENSLTIISKSQSKDEIILSKVFKGIDDEVTYISKLIKKDIADGLRPDDILVISVDDRNAKEYLRLVAKRLAELEIESNNVHSDLYGLRDFYVPNQVTLSTVHKAKGNEAYSVYVLGVDALFDLPTIKKRNMLFTAMTRSKGWVHVSGLGQHAMKCMVELKMALKHFPNLVFSYPSKSELSIMHRDLKQAAAEKQTVDRLFDELLIHLSPEEAYHYLEGRVSRGPAGRKKHPPKGPK